jgi:hypothetical protein
MMAQINPVGKPPHFDGSDYDYWKKRMCLHLKAMSRKVWNIVEVGFVVLDMKDPTPREEENLQLNDQALNVIYEALDPKVFEELNNFTRNQVWELVERPKNYNVIGTKWVFRNKQNEDGIVMRNKARLVAQGYTKVEGLDFGETYAPVARLEAIQILLAYACAHNIKLNQMDVKSVFLNEYINELVYVKQPPGFEDCKKPNHMYKLKKALYGLKQAPRAWYERLRNFLLSKGFKMGKVDTTLFTKRIENDLFVCLLTVVNVNHKPSINPT